MTGFQSKRQAAQDKLQGDDAQGYIADYEAALLISYQSGFADGKRSDQRKPLTDAWIHRTTVLMGFNPEWTTEIGIAHAIVRAAEAAHNIKENT